LLGGVANHFLAHAAVGGSGHYDAVRAIGLEGVLADLKPAAVMALGYAHPFDRAVLQCARKLRLPLLFRGETNDDAHRRGALKSLVRDFMLRGLYRRCAALLYVGKRSRQHYERLGVSESKLFFSPYCVDGTPFHCTDADRAVLREATRAKWGIASDALVILFSGKLSHRKGVDLLPEAVRCLPSAMRTRAHVVYLGDGALREELATMCAMTPEVRATFTGFQNQKGLSAFYHAADMLVLPSREKETWGLVVNEALMHGVPCVVSDAVGSQPDLVLPDVTGERFAVADAGALTEAIRKVADRNEKVRMAADCRAAVANYSVRTAASGIADALRSLSVLTAGSPGKA
jgi:glycosyltransferase involved in cell wall biosynthesis